MVGFIGGWLGCGRRSTLFVFFFFPAVGYGVVVVVVVWVDWRWSVARFIDISGLRLGSSASVSRGWVRRYQWVARVGFVVVGVVVA